MERNTKNKMKKIIALISFLVILSCSCDRLNKGIVTKKWYEAPSSHLVFVPVCTGKSCTLIPIIHYDAEKWCISVTGKTDKGKIVTNTYYVDERQYKAIKIGQLIHTNNLD